MDTRIASNRTFAGSDACGEAHGWGPEGPDLKEEVKEEVKPTRREKGGGKGEPKALRALSAGVSSP